MGTMTRPDLVTFRVLGCGCGADKKLGADDQQTEDERYQFPIHLRLRPPNFTIVRHPSPIIHRVLRRATILNCE
jgi:hypothetical protein